MKERLFVYGTLRFPKYQKEAWGKSFDTKYAEAHGFRRSYVMVNKQKYIVARPDARSSIRGAVLLLTKKNLTHADVYEDRYSRKKIKLTDGTTAWMYQYKY